MPFVIPYIARFSDTGLLAGGWKDGRWTFGVMQGMRGSRGMRTVSRTVRGTHSLQGAEKGLRPPSIRAWASMTTETENRYDLRDCDPLNRPS